jgi:hypothetical protein
MASNSAGPISENFNLCFKSYAISNSAAAGLQGSSSASPGNDAGFAADPSE